MRRIVLLALFGLFAQLIDGSLGMAYGVTSTSLLLAYGLAPACASASVHLAEVGTTLASGVSHWRFGNIDWSLVLRIGAPGAIGAFLGAVVLTTVSTETAKPVTAGILFLLGSYLLIRFFGTELNSTSFTSGTVLRTRFLLPLGLVAGFIDATGGGGWGPVATPTLLAKDRVEPRKVIGSVDASEFAVALAASLGFLFGLGRSGVSWPTVVALLVGGLVAAPIAVWFVRVVPPRMLGVSVGGLLVLTNARTLLDAFATDMTVQTWTYATIVAVWAFCLGAGVGRLQCEKGASRLAGTHTSTGGQG